MQKTLVYVSSAFIWVAMSVPPAVAQDLPSTGYEEITDPKLSNCGWVVISPDTGELQENQSKNRVLEVLIDELDIVDAELLEAAFMKDMGVTPNPRVVKYRMARKNDLEKGISCILDSN